MTSKPATVDITNKVDLSFIDVHTFYLWITLGRFCNYH
jgi:hypothetical protein